MSIILRGSKASLSPQNTAWTCISKAARSGAHLDSYIDPVTSGLDVVEGRNSGFYGVFFFDCYGGSLQNTISHRTRHHQDASSSANILIEGNHAYRNFKGPFGSHSGATDFTFQNNYSEQADAGIVWRGQDFTATGNTLKCRDGAASAIYDSDGAAADVPKSYNISNNTVKGGRYGLFIEGNIGSLRSSGNHYENTETGNTYAPVGINTLDLDTATFTNDYFVTDADYCLHAQNVSVRTRKVITVKDCRLSGYASVPARFFDTATIRYEGNVQDDAGQILDDATGVVAQGGNYGTGGEVISGRTAWTPVVEDGSGNACTLSTAYGHYAVTSSGVVVSCRVTVSSLGSASGAIKITGLPITSVNVGSYSAVGSASHLSCNIAAGVSVIPQISSNSDEIDLYVNDAANTIQAMTAAELTASGTLYIHVEFTA